LGFDHNWGEHGEAATKEDFNRKQRKGRKEEVINHEGTKVTNFKRIISEPFVPSW
jgi:hypothetical protein